MTGEAAGEAEQQPFDYWVAAVGPPAKLWRLGVGLVIGFACWFAVSIAVTWGYYYGWLLLGDETSAIFQAEMSGLATGSTYLATTVLLLASGGFWLGAVLASRLMHRQSFRSLLGAEGRISAQGFSLGVLLIAGLMLLDLVWSPLVSIQPYRNQIDLGSWALFAVPLVVLIFIQAGGEELFFRGYLVSHLAARFRNPLIWAFLPSAVFALGHFFNGVSLEHSLYYVASTLLFGLTATATVWRTGGLSVAIGMHVAMNILSCLFSGTDEFFTATPIWLSSVYDEIEAMPYMIASQILLLAFVVSPWAPMPRRQLFALRKETRAAP